MNQNPGVFFKDTLAWQLGLRFVSPNRCMYFIINYNVFIYIIMMRLNHIKAISDSVNDVIVSFAPLVFIFCFFLLIILFFLVVNTVKNTHNINSLIQNQSQLDAHNRQIETRYTMVVRNMANERMTENNRIVKVMEAIVKILRC
jgi:hypothetical protein